MTALIDTLFQLEKQLGIELDSLMPFAESDTLGGYHPDPTVRKWGSGAIWEVEGQTLYALISALKPQTIVEIGSGTGCSTNHMAAALRDRHIDGHIVTIDRGNTPYVAHELRDLIDVRNDDAINWLALQPDNSIDFLLEDADHSIPLCHAIGELAKTKLKPGGVLVAHDAAHPGVGADVKRGYDMAGLDFRVYLTDPSDCGWLVWKRPIVPQYWPNGGVTTLPSDYFEKPKRHMVTSDGDELEIVAAPPIEKLKNSEPDASPFADIDFTVLQAQEEPNATWSEFMHQVVVDAMTDVSDEPHPDMTIEPKKVKRERKPKVEK